MVYKKEKEAKSVINSVNRESHGDGSDMSTN